jgi:hypothetical protein
MAGNRAPTRTSKGSERKEYYCVICPAWTEGQVWTGTGFPQIICDGCGNTLDDDHRGHHAYERGETEQLADLAGEGRGL